MRSLAFLFVGLFFSLPGAADECVHTSTSFRCVKYIKNYDGDTITFKIPGVHNFFGDNIPVRVSGIDTAEIRTKDSCEKEKGRTARKMVKSLLSKAKRIDLENVQRGKYFRVVADVVVDGSNLKDILLKNNLARVYDGGKKSKASWCDQRLPANNP